MPLVTVAAGFAVKFGFLPDTYYHSDLALYLISAGFVLLALEQFFFDSMRFTVTIVQNVLYQLLGGLFLLFVTGFDSALTVMWLALLVYTDIYFGRKVFMISGGIMVVFALLDVFVVSEHTRASAISVGVFVILILVLAGILSYLRSVDNRERQAFERSKRQTTLQRERLITLINAMGDAVISTDAKGAVNVYNAAALNLLDTNQTLTGRSIDGLLHLVDGNQKPVKMIDILKETKSHVVLDDYAHRYEDGETVNLYISITPLRPNYRQKGQQGFILVMRDITKEKSLEEERDEFISVVSHELRTPVAITEGAISNLSLMFERGMADPALVNAAIESAHEQVVYLSKMINDLSTLSRAERGVADAAEEIDVADLVQTLYAQYRPSAESKGLAFNLDAGPRLGSVSASRLYLEEVLQNFITNAIKYTKEGHVTVRVRRSGHRVHFAISDSGIGMSKSDQKHIFEKFYRSEDYRTRETSGTGLGLYVVRKLASKLGIDIKLQSRLNHGSTFSFDMPASDGS